VTNDRLTRILGLDRREGAWYSRGSDPAGPNPVVGTGSERHILRAQEDLWVDSLRMAGVVEAALSMSVMALCHARPDLAAEGQGARA